MAVYHNHREVWNDDVPSSCRRFEERLRRYDRNLRVLRNWRRQRLEICELGRDGRYSRVLPLERRGVYVPPGEWVFAYLDNSDLQRAGLDAYLDRLDVEDEARQRALDAQQAARAEDALAYRHNALQRELDGLDASKAGVFAVKPGA